MSLIGMVKPIPIDPMSAGEFERRVDDDHTTLQIEHWGARIAVIDSGIRLEEMIETISRPSTLITPTRKDSDTQRVAQQHNRVADGQSDIVLVQCAQPRELSYEHAT